MRLCKDAWDIVEKRLHKTGNFYIKVKKKKIFLKGVKSLGLIYRTNDSASKIIDIKE